MTFIHFLWTKRSRKVRFAELKKRQRAVRERIRMTVSLYLPPEGDAHPMRRVALCKAPPGLRRDFLTLLRSFFL